MNISNEILDEWNKYIEWDEEEKNYDEIYNKSYDDGYNVGYDDGYDTGYDDGHNVGFSSGYNNALLENDMK